MIHVDMSLSCAPRRLRFGCLQDHQTPQSITENGYKPQEPDDPRLNPAPEPGWYNLTPHFLASLPRDPQALFTLIEQEYASGTAEPSKAYFQHATQLLFTAALPADLRATLYQAMTYIQGVEITDEFATIDGRTGTAIGLTMGVGTDLREDIVIDPENGSLIGRRSLGPDGSLIGTDVITNRIAEKIGEVPLR